MSDAVKAFRIAEEARVQAIMDMFETLLSKELGMQLNDRQRESLWRGVEEMLR